MRHTVLELLVQSWCSFEVGQNCLCRDVFLACLALYLTLASFSQQMTDAPQKKQSNANNTARYFLCSCTFKYLVFHVLLTENQKAHLNWPGLTPFINQ